MVTVLAGKTYRSALAFSSHDADASTRVANVAPDTLKMDARSTLDLDDRCGFMVRTWWTCHPGTESEKLVVKIIK